MNTSRFFSALIIATLAVGISGGSADAADGTVVKGETTGVKYCLLNDPPYTSKQCGTPGVKCGHGPNVAPGADCTIDGATGVIEVVWETADAKSDLTAFDETSEAEAGAQYCKFDMDCSPGWECVRGMCRPDRDDYWDEYEEDYSDCESVEEDTESESSSSTSDDAEAEAELGITECSTHEECYEPGWGDSWRCSPGGFCFLLD